MMFVVCVVKALALDGAACLVICNDTWVIYIKSFNHAQSLKNQYFAYEPKALALDGVCLDICDDICPKP